MIVSGTKWPCEITRVPHDRRVLENLSGNRIRNSLVFVLLGTPFAQIGHKTPSLTISTSMAGTLRATADMLKKLSTQVGSVALTRTST